MAEDAVKATPVRTVTIDESNDGQRIDNFLLSTLKGVPRSWVYRVLRRGEVRVNKGRCKPERRLRRGDVVRIPPVRQSEKSTNVVPARQIDIIENAVLFEDPALIVVNKPAGFAVHGGSGLSHGVIEILRASRPNAPYLELAHRLDRETSGCLMLAKKRTALRRLQDLQRQGDVEKRYYALLSGRIRKGGWRADLPLQKNTLKSGERIVRVDPQGKPAVTRFKVLHAFSDATLVEARLETGRTHQIRVHAAAAGHPILGDPKYGDEVINRTWKDRGLRRLFLHAVSLAFAWPDDGINFEIQAPLPDGLDQLLDDLKQDGKSI